MARVAILTSVHQPFDTRIFQKQARSLARAGHAVTLVAPHTGDEERDGVEIRALPLFVSRWDRMLRAPWILLGVARQLRADVYHFHDPELILVGLLLKLLGKRVIYDVHEDVARDLLDKSYLPRWSRRALSAAVGAVERLSSRAFDLVILAREDIEASFQGHPRLLLIRNYPMRAMFEGRPPAMGPDAGFILVYAGGLTEIRGAREMVDALAMLPADLGASLDIYGTFWPESLEAEIRQRPGFSSVRYHGHIPYEQLPDVLAHAHAGIVCFLPVPNNINSGPTKLFEYMASGLPVIVSDFPMWRRVVEESACGVLVDPASPASIADGIARLAGDPEGRRRMGANGRRAIRERYNWEAEAERLIAAYGALLGR